jgi:hypothetical protein
VGVRGGLVVFVFVFLGCSRFGAAPSNGEGTPVAGGDASAPAGTECDAMRPCASAALCVSGLCVAKASPCAGLHAASPTLGSGVYGVVTGTGASLQVYCDMESFEGGWTLVARSAALDASAPEVAFGWRNKSGTLGASGDAQPYSLGINGGLAFPFTEILFGARGEGKTWNGPVYERVVSSTFLDDYVNQGTAPGPSTWRAGSCRPDPQKDQPSMLSVLGFTDKSDGFFFSDQPATAFGLYADGWDTNGAQASDADRCSYTGDLTGSQGMIFVR